MNSFAHTSSRGQVPALLLTALLLLAGCGNSNDHSQAEVEFMSHMDQAQFFQRQGELKASTQEARSAMGIQPQNADPYLVLIENLITAGDGENALQQIRGLRDRLDSDGEEQEALRRTLALHEIEALKLSERYDEALEAVSALDDSDTDIKVIKANIHYQRGDLDSAESLYQDVLSDDNGAVDALVGLSRIAWDTDDPESARDYLNRAREQDPDHTGMWLWSARKAHQQGNLETARNAYTRALEDIGRYDVMTRQKYAVISELIEVLHAEGNASQAFVYEEMLANSAPGTLRANLDAARDEYQAGNLGRAARYLEEVLTQAPGHEQASIMLGMIRFQQGDMARAEELLAPHVDLTESEDMAKMLAAARIQLQRPEEARRMLEELDPDQSDPGVISLIGIASLAMGEQELGEGLIEQSLEMVPENAVLRERYVRYLLGTGDFERAMTQLNKGIEAVPDNDPLRILLAQAHVQAGDLDQAQASVDQWRENQPENPRALSTAGDLAQARGDNDEARALYRSAIELDAGVVESHSALGNLEARAGNTSRAAEHFRNAVRAAPENEVALRRLLAVSQQDDELLEDSIAFLNELVSERSEVIRPRLALIEYYLSEDQLGAGARAADSLARQLDDPQQARALIGEVYHRVANRAISQGDRSTARTLVNAGRERYRNHEDLALLDARLQFDRGQERDAREILRNVKTEYPDSGKPFLTEASHFMRQGEFRKAVEQFGLARSKEDTPETLVRMAFAKRQGGQTIRSVALLEEGAELFPDNEQVLLHLGMAYQVDGNDDKAMEAFERTLALAPNNAIALNNLAWLYHEAGDDNALSLAERAYRLNPNSPEIADTYGWILFNEGEVEESIAVLESALEMSPDSADIAAHLAEAYEAAGREEDAAALRNRS